jgi:D-amino-acid dehydrogenase
MSETRVVVVGAGVVGLACAWELQRAGAEVLVLERGAVGAGTSRGNTGWVCPSFTYPLPAPGMVREGIRQLVTGGEAFVLRPSLDPTFLRWLWTFRRSCSSERFEAGVRALLALNMRTLELFDEYQAAGVPFEMHTAGLIVASRTRHGLQTYRTLFDKLRQLGHDGGSVEELDGDAVASMEPALDPARVVRALYAAVDRFVRPEELTAGLASSLRASGTEVREGCELLELGRRNGAVELRTATGIERADRVVVAAGLPTVSLLRRHGVRLPMVGARGFSVTVAGRGTRPRHALYLAEAKLGVSPYRDSVRIAGVFELGASSLDVPPRAGERLIAAAGGYLGGWRPDPEEAVSAWAGLRPATADGLPLIGPLPGLDGVFLATGHGMLGVTLAPATAALLAPLVLEGRADPALGPFHPARSA